MAEQGRWRWDFKDSCARDREEGEDPPRREEERREHSHHVGTRGKWPQRAAQLGPRQEGWYIGFSKQ